jgi:sigma-B regulation protein RsbU (phosphoserine phosphatase)
MLVSIPLRSKYTAVLGLVRAAGTGFTAPEQKLADAIAANGGSQLEGVLLHQESLHQARLDLEFDLARAVQANLSPPLPTGHPGLEVYAESRAAYVVGGDFFDFRSWDGDALTCVIGDVAGKGISAALLVAMTRATIRAAARGIRSDAPAIALRRANDDLYQDFSQLGLFATVMLACFEPATMQIVIANAGHSPVIYRPANGQARLLRSSAPPIGVLPEWEGTDSKVQLAPGDMLIAATDGFTEAEDGRTEELFGYDRMLELTERMAHRRVTDVAAAFFEATDEFNFGAPVADDRTLLVLRGMASTS